jgi:hypothetical protein
MFGSLPTAPCHMSARLLTASFGAGACLVPKQRSAGVSSQWRCRETHAGQHISPGRRRGPAGNCHISSMATAATQQAERQSTPMRLTKQDLVVHTCYLLPLPMQGSSAALPARLQYSHEIRPGHWSNTCRRRRRWCCHSCHNNPTACCRICCQRRSTCSVCSWSCGCSQCRSA